MSSHAPHGHVRIGLLSSTVLALAVASGAASRGIYIRDRSTEAGLAGCLRVGAGMVAHAQRCIEVFQEVLGGGRDAWRGGSYGDDWLARRHGRDGTWPGRGALSFLAEASDLLAGQLDEDLVASLTGQLIVPRLADWCAVWLEDEATGHAGWRAGGPRLARVWHASENRIEGLSRALEQRPPHPGDPLRSGPVPYPWPGAALDGPGLSSVKGIHLRRA